MDDRVRAYLADIGRRGGTRSRRTLSTEQAQQMVARREGRRCLRAFEDMAAQMQLFEAPGFELVHQGIRDLAEGHLSTESLLVSIAAPRLQLLGIRLPPVLPLPEEELFARLVDEHGDGAHSHYNALVRRLVSFTRAVPVLRRAHARAS